jgi:tetratricopeptide (TPR) repeat protein
VQAIILLNKAGTLEQKGDPEAAVEVLKEAEPLVDGRMEPRQLWVLRFNQAVNFCHLERFVEADALLPEIRELAIHLRNELDLLRCLWIEGRMAYGFGRHDAAIAALKQVRSRFAELDLPFDAALAALELAIVYLERGETGKVRELITEMTPIFRSKKVHREAQAALDVFRKAGEQEHATVELARRLVRYLYRAQHDLQLRFEP